MMDTYSAIDFQDERFGQQSGLRFVVAILTFVLGLSSVGAQPSDLKVPGIDVETTYNFGSVLRSGGPSHFAILVSNYSALPVEGQLFLCDENDRRVLLSDVYLTQQQIQRFAWIRDLTDWDSPYLEMLDANDSDRVLHRRTLPTMQLSNGEVYALLVSNASQSFRLPSAEMSDEQPAEPATYDYWNEGYETPLVRGNDGYFVATANAKPWHLPDHFGPLVEFPTIVFADNADVSNLNVAQWRALAEWVAMGGQLYYCSDIPDFRKLLTAESPFQPGPVQDAEGFQYYACGAGRLIEYDAPLIAAGRADQSNSVGRRITRQTAEGVIQHPTKMVSAQQMRRSYSIEPNRARMIGGMIIYGLLSGLVTMVMFRRTQRQVAIYLFSIVGLATCAAIVLGVQIRKSKGIVQFRTVTQAGSEGSAQYGVARLFSSGGLNQPLKMTGHTPEVRLCGRNSRPWYYSGKSSFDLAAYDLGDPRSGSPEVSDTVPIGPWGTRDLFATDFPEGDLRIRCQLKVRKQTDGYYQIDLQGSPPSGLEFRQAVLLLVDADRNEAWMESTMRITSLSIPLPKLIEGEDFEVSIKNRLSNHSSSNLSPNFGNDAELHLGEPPARGVHAWIVGNLGRSPSLKIDETIGYDIDSEQHLFIQKLTQDEFEMQRTAKP